MKITKNKSRKSYISLKQRITAAFMVVVLLLQICLPTVALANVAWGNNFNTQIATELNSPLFVKQTAADAVEAYTGAFFIHKNVLDTRNIQSLHDKYPAGLKDATAGQLIGDTFVQTRLIRAQYRAQMGRFFFIGVLQPELMESESIKTLYDNAEVYARNNNYRFGEALNGASVSKDMIWPEKRRIGTADYLVPVVYLSQSTLEKRMTGHLVAFNSNAAFAGIILDFTTLVTGNNSIIEGMRGFINNGATISSPGNLTLKTSGTLANMGGTITADDNIAIYAGDVDNKTLLIPYKDKNGQGTRVGQVASIGAGGNLLIESLSDIEFLGAQGKAGETITLRADNNIVIGPVITEGQSNTQQGHWEINKSTTDLIMSRLAAEDTLSLIAGGVINITASELISSRGGIELLAGEGIFIDDGTESDQKIAVDKKGKTTGQSSEFRTEAVRALLKAGKNIRLESDVGNIKLKAVDITSADGTSVIAKDGAVQLLTTTELEEKHLQTVRKGTWTIKTRTEDIVHETKLQNAIVGGLQVEATGGIKIEYVGDPTKETLKGQLDSFAKMPGLSWMAEIYNSCLVTNKTEANITGIVESTLVDVVDPSTITNAQGNNLCNGKKINWAELEEIHKDVRKTKRNLSPAAMALVAIAITIATSGAGAGALAGGSTQVTLGSVAQAAMGAGLTAIETQVISSLLAGNSLDTTIRSLDDDEFINSLATTMVTAGAMHAMPSFELFPVENTTGWTQSALEFGNQAITSVANATVSAGISMAVNGGNSDTFKQMFIQSVAMDAINTVGEKLANKIGDAAKLPKDQRISVGAKYISHAALGCMTGALTSQLNDADKKLGCASGAGGAVIGEYVGSLYADKLDEEMKEWIDESIKEDGERPSFEQQQEKFDYFKAKGVDMARLAAALTAFATGGDVNIAANSGQNAAQNNALNLALVLIEYLKLNGDGDILKGLAAVGAREDYLTRMYDALVGEVNEYGQQVYKVVAAGNEEEIQLVGALLTELWKITPFGMAEDAAAKALTAGITVVVESETGSRTTKAWNSLTEQEQNQIKGAARIVEITMDAASRGRLGAVKNMIEMPAGQINMTEMLKDKDHPDWSKVDSDTKYALTTNVKGLIGKDFEDYLTKVNGGGGSFSVGGREFDGGVGNRWWEAKSGRYWENETSSAAGLEKFKSDMGARKSIANQNGAVYELHSNTPIPQHIKEWLKSKDINYVEY